jgi:capsular polysaccharide biosynthesis protein
VQIRDYWSIISKRWWLILLVAIAAVGVTVGYAKLQQPTYRATVKLTVTPSRYDYGLTMVIESLLRQYSQRIQTDKLADAVNDRLQLLLPAEKLRGKIKVSPVAEDYILMITVDDTDPNRARDIAFVWADEFVKEQQILMAPVQPTDRIEVAVLDKPAPGDLFFPKTKQLAVAAAALGLVLGLVLAFLLEYLDDTLKTTEDVERYLTLPVLGSIPSAGASDFTAGAHEKRATASRAGLGG